MRSAVLLTLLVAFLVSCKATEPTTSPTQTPWVITAAPVERVVTVAPVEVVREVTVAPIEVTREVTVGVTATPTPTPDASPQPRTPVAFGEGWRVGAWRIYEAFDGMALVRDADSTMPRSALVRLHVSCAGGLANASMQWDLPYKEDGYYNEVFRIALADGPDLGSNRGEGTWSLGSSDLEDWSKGSLDTYFSDEWVLPLVGALTNYEEVTITAYDSEMAFAGDATFITDGLQEALDVAESEGRWPCWTG